MKHSHRIFGSFGNARFWFVLSILISTLWGFIHPAHATCKFGAELLMREASRQDPGKAIVQQVSVLTRQGVARNRIPYPGYLEAIEQISRRDPDFARLVRMFDQGHYTFAIDQSSSVRAEILQHGFLNQHQTRTSAGVVRSDGGRDQVEAMYLRMKVGEYRELPAEWKPKSMYLIPTVESGIGWESTHYSVDPVTGIRTGDTWILKRPEIERNSLFLVGDSFDRALVEGDLSDDFKSFDIRARKKLDERSPVSYLLPLDWIKSSIPHYYEQVKNRNLFRYVDPENFKVYYEAQRAAGDPLPTWREVREDSSRPEFEEGFFKMFPELKRFEKLLVRPYGNYSEGLYFGRLDPTKIEALVYRSRPPTEGELRRLRELGIRVLTPP